MLYKIIIFNKICNQGVKDSHTLFNKNFSRVPRLKIEKNKSKLRTFLGMGSSNRKLKYR